MRAALKGVWGKVFSPGISCWRIDFRKGKLLFLRSEATPVVRIGPGALTIVKSGQWIVKD